MKSFSRFFLAGLLLSLTAHAKEPELRIPSPDGKFQLLVNQGPEPDDPNQALTWFSICDGHGKLIKKVYGTVFPVEAIKWHKTADVAIILEHITGEQVMSLILRKNGIWRNIEVDQFKNPIGGFHVIDAVSAPTAFQCYYLAFDRPTGFTAYRTEVSLLTGKAVLKETRRVSDDDAPFYQFDPTDVLYQMEVFSPQGSLHCHSLGSEDEPDWYGVRR